MGVNIKLGEFTTEADQPRAVSQPRITTPAIVVLLGSTASLSALELMRHMLTLQPNDRRRVALIYIDTDDPSTSLVEFRQTHNGVFQEFPLRIAVPAGISVVERVGQKMGPMEDSNPALEPHTFLKGKEPQYFANGAGGIRNNGHVAACFHHESIRDTLDRALASIVRLDNRQNTRRAHEIQANIVAFLGGGTGSGILPDITVMMRELLTRHQYRQRINLFCMLPEPVKGATPTDLSWRRSNTTACLLEVLAYSMAASAVTTQPRLYEKYMREKYYLLTNDPIANEVYLIGNASMDDSSGTARLVGLDLFQRITDASGVGFLEHSKWVDRRTLGESDDRGLPTVFGTSCPLEVRFPAEETATAFACLSAASLLPLLARYQPASITVSENDQREWMRKWKDVALIDANPSNPKAIRPGILKITDFEEADQLQLDNLWSRLERFERETERRIKEMIENKRREEVRRIHETPRTPMKDDGTSLLDLRVHRLQYLKEEYTFVLESLKSGEVPRVPRRPVELEAEVIQPTGGWNALLRGIGLRRNAGYDVYEAYNRRMYIHAVATRQRLLEVLLNELIHLVEGALKAVESWFEETDVDDRVQELEAKALTSMAWQGRLDYPHPHQRHIFELRTLRSSDGRNIAIERLYLWATGGEKVLNEGTNVEYGAFIENCINYLARKSSEAQGTNKAENGQIEDQNAGRLADRVVDFFREYYIEQFQDSNLFELLDKAVPPSAKGQSRVKQISTYLLEHLQHMSGLMSSLVAFEAELWGKGLTTLDTSIYLGMHWRDGYQRGILEQAVDTLGSFTARGQAPMIEASIDPHRFQVVYGQHAISLGTVRDFYLEQNSAMEAYNYHQEKWENGGTVQGYMPTHSSEEAQRLVREKYALPFKPATPLYQRLIRKPSAKPGA